MPQRVPISFIATTEPDAAKAFYGGILGLKLVEETVYALAFEDGDHMLRVQVVGAFSPADHTAHGWQVMGITAQITDLSAKGVAFLRFDHLPQDASGIWTTPEGNKVAWFKDPAGNILSLTEYASSEPHRKTAHVRQI